MARHLIERLDPLIPIFNRRHVLADERVDGRPHQRPRSTSQAAEKLETVSAGWLQPESLGLFDDERLQNIGKDFVFPQQLVNRGPLAVSEPAKFTRFFDHNR